MIFIRRDPPRDPTKAIPLIIKLDARRSAKRLIGDARYAAESMNWPGYVMYKGDLKESTWVKIMAEVRHEQVECGLSWTEWRQTI